jgi:hypothetical protein
MQIEDQNAAETLTERQLAKRWNLSARTLQRWRKEGRGPDWMRIGRRILYSQAAVLAFEEQNRNGGRGA